jgi:hypothetical protein
MMTYVLEKYHSCGSRSDFYTLKDSIYGFKTFKNKDDAERARSTQIVLAEHDLAPKVYSEVGRIKVGKSKKRQQLSNWGYITEVAELPGCGGNACECGDCEYLEDELFDEIENLKFEINETTNYYFSDAHVGNIGYVRRGIHKLLVCIDTGYESVSTYDPDDDDCDCSICMAAAKGNK